MGNECQIHCLERLSLPRELLDNIEHVRTRLKRFLKRRWTYILKTFRKRKPISGPGGNVIPISQEVLEAGDIVRIRSKEEISGMLDMWNQSQGCAFMEEMWQYCGTVHRVLKRVRKFLDERDYRMKSCKGIVILEGVTCEGTRDFGICDRSCYFFWREEWLEKIGKSEEKARAT